MSLKKLSPEPIQDFDLQEKQLDADGQPGIPLFPISKRWISLTLHRIQKYSTIPLGMYFPLHGINTLIVPSISAGSAPDDVLMMVRELLPSFTTKLLIGSLSLHLASGLILRTWKFASSYYNMPKKKKHAKASGMHFQLQDASELDSQRVIGLTGGLLGYFTGFRKRFSLSPQVLTGYILTPLLVYHLLVMKLLPTHLKVDVDFNYVKWIIQNANWRVKWIAGIAPLALLIWSGTYHICAGMCQYLGIKKLSARRKWSNLITLASASGLFALYKLCKHLTHFIGSEQYERVFHKLYFL